MLRTIPILMVIASCGCICAQDLPPLVMPHTDRSASKPEAPVQDVTVNYANRHEAALAAFQAGYKAAAVERNRTRAIRLLLVALRRDPQLPPALFDMAVLCSQENRWRDAISFLQEAQKQAAANSEVAPLAAAELKRVETVERLESTGAGKTRRQFDTEFVTALKKVKDPFALKALAEIDTTRWEAPALAGILYADLGEFSNSMAELEKAALLSDPARAAHLKSAANVARQESGFLEDRKTADGFSEKQQHAPAAQLYAKAWEESQGHWDIALEAVTEYLLADDTDRVVRLLSRLRDTAPPALSARALAMLRELGTISADANRASERVPASEAPQPPPKEPAALIREQVGPLTNPDMELAVKPEPPLLNDKTPIIPVPDAEIENGSSDLLLLSTTSIFGLYRQNLTAAAASYGTPPQQARSEPPEPPKDAQPAPAPAAPRAAGGLETGPSGGAPASSVAKSPRGTEQTVSIRSTPSGATVLLDDTLNCVTPCQLALAPLRHTLRATLTGYRDALRIFVVEKGKAPFQMDLPLEEKRGWLNVEAEIPGAPIFLNGVKTDKRTPARFILKEGTYEVGVEIDAKRSVQKVAIVDEGLAVLKF